jgi:hypothetical protein
MLAYLTTRDKATLSVGNEDSCSNPEKSQRLAAEKTVLASLVFRD